jgi:hypothetical protein
MAFEEIKKMLNELERLVRYQDDKGGYQDDI